ncbi:MAG: chloride channel protein [Acidimicrobiia bacterium]|nr:chloride channel protein [Acidimicrobiia bacterium]
MTTLRAKARQLANSRGQTAFLAAALVIGFIVGLAVVLLVILVEAASEGAAWVHEQVGSHSVGFFLTVPAGLLIAWIIADRFSKNIESGGVTETISAVGLRAGYLSTRTILPKIASTAATLGGGGSGGREGPIVMIGAAIGSSLSRYTRFSEDRIRSLVAAGAGAGIGATFDAPIAGMLFAMEVILGNLAIRHLNAVVVASVVAAVTTHTLVGEEQILSSPGGSFDDPRELILYLVLGLLAVGAGLLFVRILTWVNDLKARYRYPDWTRPLAAGLLIASIGLIDDRALGTGQAFLSGLMRIESTSGTDLVLWTLPLLILFKMVTNALTRSGGGSAGTFMPSLFIGGILGTGLVLAVEPLWFGDLEPASYAMVGMAATFAAVARAPLTSIIMVFEITGNYELVLPLMLAASIASFIADRIQPDSVYTMPLTKAGVHLVQNEDVDLLDTVTVGEVMTHLDDTLSPTMTIAEAARFLDESRHHGMPVVEQNGRLAGVLTLIDVALAEGDPEQTLVRDAMTDRPITVTPTMPVSSALARMAALGVGRLPVVDDVDPRRCVGMFRRNSVVAAYHHALGAVTDRHLYRQRLRQRVQPGATFYEVPVLPGSEAAGQLIRDLHWPEEAVLVSIRRDASVIIPHGDTVLRVNDTITAFGHGDSRIAVAYLLEQNQPADGSGSAGSPGDS